MKTCNEEQERRGSEKMGSCKVRKNNNNKKPMGVMPTQCWQNI